MGFQTQPDVPDRLWSRVDVRGPDDCWEFTGGRLKRGYGLLTWAGQRVLAHRLAFFLSRGVWPDGYCCHTCDNPPCCNPTHLFAGAPVDNVRDMHAKQRESRGQRHGQRIRAGLARSAPSYEHVRGSRNGRARISDAGTLEIRKRYAEGNVSQAQLAREYGISQPQVSRLIRGEQRAVIEE